MWERLSSRDNNAGYINEIAAGKPLPQCGIFFVYESKIEFPPTWDKGHIALWISLEKYLLLNKL